MPKLNLFIRVIIAFLLFPSTNIGLRSSQAQTTSPTSTSGQYQPYTDLQHGLTFLYPKEMTIMSWQGTVDVPASVSLQASIHSTTDENPEVGVSLYRERTQDALGWLNSHRSTGLSDPRPVVFADVEILDTVPIAGQTTIFFAHHIFGRTSLSALRIIDRDQLVIVTCTDGCTLPTLQSGFVISTATLHPNAPLQPDAREQLHIQDIVNRYISTYVKQPKPGSPDSRTQDVGGGYWLPFPTNVGWVVSQGWNTTYSHNGKALYAYDFAMSEGSTVVASRDGTVDVAVGGFTACGGSGLANSANRVVIKHDDNTATLYLHLQSVSVSVGRRITHGELIGRSGKTGWTECGPHLHFQRQDQGIWWTQSKEVYFNEYPNQQLTTGNRYVANHSASAGCAIAVGDGTSRPQMFIDAYNRKGGRDRVGCPVNGTHWWGDGSPRSVVIQDFRGGPAGDVAIIHDENRDSPASSTPAYVLQGGIWQHYIRLGGWESWLGPPTSDEFENETGQAQNNFRSGYIGWNNGSPVAIGWPAPAAQQWYAEYHNGRNLNNYPTWVRNETSIDNNWGTGAPGNGRWGVWADNFSVRWTGDFTFAAGTYVFNAAADDGVRVFVDGALVIDGWRDQTVTQYRATRTLSAGIHRVVMEYYEGGGGATAQLFWSTNLALRSQPYVTSPQDGNTLPANGNAQVGKPEQITPPTVLQNTYWVYLPQVVR